MNLNADLSVLRIHMVATKSRTYRMRRRANLVDQTRLRITEARSGCTRR